MAQTLKLKRSAVSGNAPGTSDLALGEIAINTYDGKIFIKKDDGTESIVTFSAGGNAGSIEEDSFTGDGSTVAFTISTAPSTEENLLVFIDAAFQNRDSFTVSGTTVTFDTAPDNTSSVRIYHVIPGTVDDGILTVAKFAASAIVTEAEGIASNDNDTTIPTSAAVKDYVDTQVATVDTLPEVLANGNTTGGTDISVSTGDDITFADSSKAIFGAGSDLQIYHDGTRSIINDVGTGDLQFQVGGSAIFDVTADGIVMEGFPESAYEIKGDLDGGIRFTVQAGEALSKGDVVYISGAAGANTIVSKAQANSASTMPGFGLVLADIANGGSGQVVTFGNLYGSGGAALDTSTYSIGDSLYVSATTAGAFTETAPTGESNLVQNIGKVLRVATSNGVIKVGGAGRTNATPNLDQDQFFLGNASNQSVAVDFSDAVEALSINNVVEDTTPQLGGDLASNGNDILFADNDKAIFGAGSDLQIYHNGTNSFIREDGVGSLRIQGADLELSNPSEIKWLKGYNNNRVELFFNNSKKLATTSTGIDVTGNIESTGFISVEGASGNTGAGTDRWIGGDGTAGTWFYNVPTGFNHYFAVNNTNKLAVNSTGIDVTGVITTDGLTTSADINFGDSDKAIFGAGSDLQIYHNSTDSVIDNITGDLYITNKTDDGDIIFRTDDGSGGFTSYIQADGSTGEVRLYHYGSEKLNTYSEGVQVDGRVITDSLISSGITNFGNIIVTGTVDGVDIAARDAILTSTTTTANAALPRAGGALTGAVTTNSTFDGRDVATDGTKLDTIETSATADQTQAEINALGITATGLSGTPNITVGSITQSGNLQQNNNNEIKSKDTGGTARTIMRVNSSNELEYGWSGNGKVKIMGGGSYTERFSIGTDGNATFSGTISSGNITTTGYIRGPSTFTIDPATHGDDTGTLVIAGNLQVDGTTTTINSTTLTVDDKLVTLASGSLNAAAADGAGIEVEISGVTYPSIKYDGTNDEWDFNKPINLTGDGHDLLINSADYELVLLGNRGSTGVNLDKAYLRMKAEGTNTVVIDTAGDSYFNGGNVGIGTTSPSSKLDIDTSGQQAFEARTSGGYLAGYFATDFDYVCKFESTDGTACLVLEDNNSTNNANRICVNTNDMYFDTAGSERMRILANGNVGIGTDAPGADLHIGGQEASAPTAGTIDRLHIQPYSNTGGPYKFKARTVSGSSDFLDMYYGSNHIISYGLDGKVGIGITAPQAKLHVDGTTIFDTATGSQPVYFTRLGNINESLKIHCDDRGAVFESIQDETADTYGNFIFAMDAGVTEPYFDVRKGTADSASIFRVDGGGNVGIGITSPSRKLDINAGVNDGVKIASSNALIGGGASGGDTQLIYWNGTTAYYGRSSLGGSVSQHEFRTGGTTRLTIDTDGDVGIGTTPYTNARLTIGGTSTSYNSVLQFDNNTTGGAEFFMLASDNTWSAGSNKFFMGHGAPSSSAVDVTIDADGKVGIGSTSPATKLQVEEYGIDTTETSTTATTQVAIHTFAAATFRSARFTVQVTNSTDSTYHLTEILMIHDGTTPSITEYGTIFTGSAAEATFDADISSGNVRLLATPASTDAMEFKVVSHSITT